MRTNVVDLSAFMPVETIDVEILAPGTGAPTGWVVTLCSPGHERAVAWQSAQVQAQLTRAARLEAQVASNRRVRPDEKSVDEQKALNVGWIVSRILTWTPVKLSIFGDAPLEFSDEVAARVLSHPSMWWLYAQLVEYLADERNFTPRSATT